MSPRGPRLAAALTLLAAGLFAGRWLTGFLADRWWAATVSPETGKIQRITQDQGLTNQEPTWAPNGRLLAFTSDRGGRAQLVVSTPQGERQTVITSDAMELETPAWGPWP